MHVDDEIGGGNETGMWTRDAIAVGDVFLQRSRQLWCGNVDSVAIGCVASIKQTDTVTQFALLCSALQWF